MGKKQASYGSDGRIFAFYDTVDSPAPAGASVIDITDEQWQTCLANPGWTVSNNQLVAPMPPTSAQELEAARRSTVIDLTQECANAIVSGFESNALGTAHAYPSSLTDQANQSTVAGCLSGGSLWCESDGSWSLVPHTQAQAQAVVASFASWLNKCQQQLAGFVEQVSVAKAMPDVRAIVWVNPV